MAYHYQKHSKTLRIKLFPKAGWHALILLLISIALYTVYFFYFFIKYWEYVSLYGQMAAVIKYGLILGLGFVSLPLTYIYIYLIWNKSKHGLVVNKNGLYLYKFKTSFIPWKQVERFCIKQIQKYFTIIKVADDYLFEVDLGNQGNIRFIIKGKLKQSEIDHILTFVKLAKGNIN